MIEAFLVWWMEQLSGLVPAGLRQVDQAGRSGLLLTLDDAAITAALRKRGSSMAVGRFPIDRRGQDALTEELRRSHSRRLPLILSVPGRAVLRKSMTLPLVARRNLRQILEMEMEHETPFAPDEVVWDYRIARLDREFDRMEIELFLVPRERIAPIDEVARNAGVLPDAVEITGDGGIGPLHIPLNSAAATRPALRHAGVAAGCAALLLAVVAAALPYVRLERALLDARADVAALQDKVTAATALRDEVERLSRPMAFLARERARAYDPLTVLAAATRAIPNDAYLTEISLHGDHVTLVGFSPSAADLIGVLSAAKPLRDATFGAPVVRPDGNKLELFSINANLTAPEAR